MITIVGLGPSTLDDLPLKTFNLLQDATVKKFFRTGNHPAAKQLLDGGIDFGTFDHLYNELDSFTDLYKIIAGKILDFEQDVVYAVPGHPLVAEESVINIITEAKRRKKEYTIIPAASFIDYIFTSLEIDPVNGLSIIDGLQIDKQKPILNRGNIITQVYNQLVASDVKLSLMDYYPDDYLIVVVRGLGIKDEEQILEVPLYQLDRIKWVDHLTSLYVPPLSSEDSPARYPLDPLVDVMAQLRGVKGCPWDKEQTHQSLKKYMLEEAYEVLETIEENDMDKLQEELGDVLLQVVFHSQIATENEYFDINDVIMEIKEKLIRRHPHVFADTVALTSGQVTENWEKIKQKEKERSSPRESSILSNITKTLPALTKSEKIQKKAARVGFDWPDYKGALEKIFEEIGEFEEALQNGGDTKEVEGELGDILFAVVNLARFFKIDPEEALNRTSAKFVKRFNYIEEEVKRRGYKLGEVSLKEMDEIWNLAKNEEKEQNRKI